MTQKALAYNLLGITPAAIYEQMGYGQAVPDEATRLKTAAIIAEVEAWLQPRFCYQVLREQPPLDMSPIILRQLRGAEAYAVFVCTAGIEFEDWQQQLKAKDDIVRTFIADALGSVIAECCADQMEFHLQTSIDKLGWHRTNRFSPGYCGWHVSRQQQLFRFLPPAPCGVRLTDSSLMVPVKSVSGIIGLGTHVRRLDYTCGLCDFQQCYKRKSKTLVAAPSV